MPTGTTETDEERAERTGLSSLEMGDAEAAAVQKTANRVTLDSMVSKIADVEYIKPNKMQHMTIAVVIMQNGWAVVGKSAPADAENYNSELGRKFAYEDAIRQLWPLEGYLLRNRMYEAEVTETITDHAS
jgi:hypothetical protein